MKKPEGEYVNMAILEDLKSDVQAIAEAVKDLKEFGLSEDILLIAIQRSAKKFHTGGPIGVKHIKWILEGLENLDEYLFPHQETTLL